MQKSLSTICLVFVLLFTVPALAADKVVVIPLGGKNPIRTLNPASTNVPEGYYMSSDLAAVDTDLKPGNIPVGINIFGIQGTLPVADFYIDNGNDTVTSSATGLMWQQIGFTSYLNWNDAGEYCNTMELGGYEDWRLPTKEELKGLVLCTNGTSTPLPDYTTCGGGYDVPTIDPIFSCGEMVYWTSTLDTVKAWGVNFFNGYTNTEVTNGTFRSRCVRML